MKRSWLKVVERVVRIQIYSVSLLSQKVFLIVRSRLSVYFSFLLHTIGIWIVVKMKAQDVESMVS